MTLQLIKDGEDGLFVRNKLNSLVLTYNASGIEPYNEGSLYFRGDYAIFLNRIVQCMYGTYRDSSETPKSTIGQFAPSQWREVKTDAMLKGTNIEASIPNFSSSQSARLNTPVTLLLETSEIAFSYIPSSLPGADYGVVWCGGTATDGTELRYTKTNHLQVVAIVASVENILADWDLSGVAGVTSNLSKQIRFQLSGAKNGAAVEMALRYRVVTDFTDFEVVGARTLAGVAVGTTIQSGILGNNPQGTKPIGKLQHIYAGDSTQQHYWPLEEGGTNSSFAGQHPFWDVIGKAHGILQGTGIWGTINTPTSYNFAYGYTEVNPATVGVITGKPRFVNNDNIPIDGFTRIEAAYRLSHPLTEFENITLMRSVNGGAIFYYGNDDRVHLQTTGGLVSSPVLSSALQSLSAPELKFQATEPVTHKMNTHLTTSFQDLDVFGGDINSLKYFRAKVTGGGVAQAKDKYTHGAHDLGSAQWLLYYTDTDGTNTNAVGVVVQFGFVGNDPKWLRARGIEVRWAPGTDYSKLWTAGQYNTMALAPSPTTGGHTLYDLEVTNGTRTVNMFINESLIHTQSVNAASPYLTYEGLGYFGANDTNSKVPNEAWSISGWLKSFVRGSTTDTIYTVTFNAGDWDGASQTALRTGNRDYTVSSDVTYQLNREAVANYRVPYTSTGQPITDNLEAGLTLVQRPANFVDGGNMPAEKKQVAFGPFRVDTGDNKLKHFTLVNGVETWQEV